MEAIFIYLFIFNDEFYTAIFSIQISSHASGNSSGTCITKLELRQLHLPKKGQLNYLFLQRKLREGMKKKERHRSLIPLCSGFFVVSFAKVKVLSQEMGNYLNPLNCGPFSS